MVENIRNCVEDVSTRGRATELKNELIRWEDILKRKFLQKE